MGCGASTKPTTVEPTDDEVQEAKRREAAEKIQAVWTAKADSSLKSVEDSVEAILQNLGTAVQNQDEAAIRYEIVQIQKLAPPTIALVRAHAGGRCIKVPPAAAKALVQDVTELLDSGSKVPLGLLMSIERSLSIFSWPGREGEKVLKAGDDGNWTLDLGAESNAGNLWPRVRVQAATGRLIEVLSDVVKWRIDAATLALQELAAVCASGHRKEANASTFDAAAFLPSLLCPEDLEMEFGQGIRWERIVVERQQVLLAAAYHVGGDAAVCKLLGDAADLINAVEPDKCKQAWLLIWDGLARSAAQLRPSLFHSAESCQPGEEVRVMGLLECPEFNGEFGVVLDDDAIIRPSDEGMVAVRIGEALACLPLQRLARQTPEVQCQLQAAVRSFAAALEENLLPWMTEWFQALKKAADGSDAQPSLAPAMSSQFVSTSGRIPCYACGTFLFTVDGSCDRTCVVCGANFDLAGASSSAAIRSTPSGSLARVQWQCPQCKQLFDCWEDREGNEGLLTHLQESKHAKTKGGKSKFKVHLEKVQRDTSGGEDLEEPMEEELQIFRLFRLLPRETSCDRSAFASSVGQRWSMLPEGSGNRRTFAIASNLCGVPLAPSDSGDDGAAIVIMPDEICTVKADARWNWTPDDFKKCVETEWESWKTVPPVLLALAAGLPECEAFCKQCRKYLLQTEDSFVPLKEALLSIYDIPEPLRRRLLDSDEYAETLQRCRAAGELPVSWDLGNLLDNNNAKPAAFLVTIDKAEGAKLGIDVTSTKTCVTIEDIDTGSGDLIASWNENNPDASIKKGDSIIAVNGISGDGSAIAGELAKSGEMKIEIRPGDENNIGKNKKESPNTISHRNSSAGEVVGRKTLSDKGLITLFQNFMDKTWLNKWTHDRKGDPWGENVPSGFDVQEVVQVMNMKSWQDYLDARKRIKEALPGKKAPKILADIDAPMTADPGMELVATYPVAGGPLKKDLNEAWLWHGTKPMAADNIVASDFEISRAGTHFGTLYGNGIYLAEVSTKADEYCRETNDKGWRSMLLCRTVLGQYFYRPAETTGEECENAVLKGSFHSVLGDRRKFRKTFREFVFMDHRQVYPCFLVFYTRREAIPKPPPKPKPEAKKKD